MEEKFLKLFKLANLLNEKQDNVFAEIDYSANNNKTLKIAIRSKKDFSYIQTCQIQLINNPLISWDNIIKLFEQYLLDVEKKS